MMPKQNNTFKIILIFTGCLALMVLTVWGAIWVSNIDNRKAAAKFPLCEGKHTVRKVVIEDNAMHPEHTEARRCDTLVITNKDERPRIIAFGVHDKHVAYDGVTERYISPQGKFQVTLIQPGKNFLFHDHNQEEVAGTFTVSP